MSLRIQIISGSARTGSFNQQLASVIASRLQAEGHTASEWDFRAHPLPMYDGDLEAEGLPETVAAIKKAVAEADAVVFVSPEYNASMSPLLKNALDWISRPGQGAAPDNAWGGKVVMLSAASPGGLGGIRGLSHLRDSLTNVGALVLPGMASVGVAHEAFAEDGSLKDERTASFLDSALAGLAAYAAKLKG
jgi:NAD(P)H-dependent FMN reductase